MSCHGGLFALALSSCIVTCCCIQRYLDQRNHNRELVRALRVYLRDSRDVREDRDKVGVERRRAYIATLIKLKPGELAPEWKTVEPKLRIAAR